MLHSLPTFSQRPYISHNYASYLTRTVTVQAEKDSSVLLAITKTKKLNKPSAPLHKSALNKKFSKMSKAFSNKAADNYYRPNMKNAALARLSAVNRSLKVSKSRVKKRRSSMP
ncbi:hypothetical protein M9H77_35074 [Catharanthus roseus]|uniref:Uncharacterized protein n=1 Tax=Catharanthus roseus TaxID=4058 RepID=A0ACB9ZN05_CATRO|nr:hypothetical protein M9H77_35074 [Catharanthus roseus]